MLDTAPQTKHCKRCDQDLPLDAFGTDRKRRDGKAFYCRDCTRELAAERKRQNPEIARAAQDRYRENHPGVMTARSKAWKKANPEATQEANRRYRERHPEAAARHSRLYKERHPDRVKARQRRQDLRKYGLTVETFDAMLIAQSGRCACCEDELLKPCVDHHHGTGQVRALLCTHCNTMLGNGKEDPKRLLAGIRYLEEFTLVPQG